MAAEDRDRRASQVAELANEDDAAMLYVTRAPEFKHDTTRPMLTGCVRQCQAWIQARAAA
jgi:hypothetical protein